MENPTYEMEEPTYKKLAATLAASVTGNDNSYRHVIKAMQEQVEPAIARMTKPQLVEAFAEAVLCIHNMGVELRSYEGTDGIIETKHREYLIERLTVAHLENELKAAPAKARKASSKNALDVKHNKPGGAHHNKKRILEAWATGRFKSRDVCADQEYDECGYKSFSAARKALIGSPDHDKCPANPKKKK